MFSSIGPFISADLSRLLLTRLQLAVQERFQATAHSVEVEKRPGLFCWRREEELRTAFSFRFGLVRLNEAGDRYTLELSWLAERELQAAVETAPMSVTFAGHFRNAATDGRILGERTNVAAALTSLTSDAAGPDPVYLSVAPSELVNFVVNLLLFSEGLS